MLYVYINNSDRTADIIAETLQINNEIQQRVDSAEFNVFQNSKPTENQDVKIYKGSTISSIASATVVLNAKYQTDVSMFFAGQKLRIGIGNSDEETVEVLTYDEATRTIVLTAAPDGTHIAGDKIGQLIFGGVVNNVQDYNVDVLQNIEYTVTCVDYTKIFDKKNISDSWVDRDSRYIINSFCNSTINYNHQIDQMDYDTNGDIQTEWVAGAGAGNATTSATDPYEADHWGVFPITTTAANQNWTATPTQSDVAALTGAVTGTPTKGLLGFWVKIASLANMNTLTIAIGSDSSNYIVCGASAILNQVAAADTPVYIELDLANDFTVTGTPDWENFDYIRIVGKTAASTASVSISGIRILEKTYFRHYPYVEETTAFDDFRAPYTNPTQVMQILAKSFEYVWYIDYERYIHFAPNETEPAPYQITETSDNFTDLSVEVDQTHVGNRIRVLGGEYTSDSFYREAFQGDDVRKEWNLKTKFNNLTVKVDNNTSTDLTEGGTTATNITIAGHGLVTGDWIVNRTRSAAREITFVDANNFTVKDITGQTNGDTLSFFSNTKVVGIEGADNNDTSKLYLSNSNAATVRLNEGSAEGVLPSTSYILFIYNERLELNLEYSDPASIDALKAAGIGDGIKDLDPIVDKSIRDQTMALTMAQARVREFSNAIITGKFKTSQSGLRAGQLLHVVDSSRSLDDTFVIQKIKSQQAGGEFGDYFEYSVDFGTTLFGWVEFLQLLLRVKDNLEVNADAIVAKNATSNEVVESSDVNATALDGGFMSAKSPETVESNDVNVTYIKTSGSWQWEASVGQTLATRWNLFDWG